MHTTARLEDRIRRAVRPPPEGTTRRRVLVVSAGMGAGHHAAADELVGRLRRDGHAAERVDVLDLGRRGQGRRLQRTYSLLLRRLPWVYDLAMRLWARWPGPLELLTARGAAAYERGLLRQVERFRPDVVVSVYNLASQALGRLRAAGRLHVPVVTYVTDPGAHPYWVQPAVDLHLAILPQTAQALRCWGADRTAIVSPLVGERFLGTGLAREGARQRLGLPVDAVLALVSAGSWGAGDVDRTVRSLAATGSVEPVVLCGRDDGLRRRLARDPSVRAIGWTDDVAVLMAAVDVFVDNAGGMTCWEALAAGLPVVVFRPLPGHGRFNAGALEAAGLAAWARSEQELLTVVHREAGRGRLSRDPLVFSGDAVSAVLQVCTAGSRTA
jgi:processive 1,2-diacylglycerol beta-glucosyltransferase